MQIEFLGAHQYDTAKIKPVSLLVDDVLAIDSGSLTPCLSLERQEAIQALLISHYHYDHIRDLPTLAFNRMGLSTLEVYCPEVVREAVMEHLFNDKIWIDLTRIPPEKPAVRFHSFEADDEAEVAGYQVRAFRSTHAVPSVGFLVRKGDASFYYTSDTGPGSAPIWTRINPQLLIIETTFPNREAQLAVRTGHLTPALLREELVDFREVRGHLPRVVLDHMNPRHLAEIRKQVGVVAQELGSEITFAYEGLKLRL